MIETSNDKEPLGCRQIVLLLLMSLTIVPVSVGLNGVATMLIWNWFMVPLFGLPAVGYWLGLGLAMALKYLTAYLPAIPLPDKKKPQQQVYREVRAGYLRAVLCPLGSIAFGWFCLWMAA